MTEYERLMKLKTQISGRATDVGWDYEDVRRPAFSAIITASRARTLTQEQKDNMILDYIDLVSFKIKETEMLYGGDFAGQLAKTREVVWNIPAEKTHAQCDAIRNGRKKDYQGFLLEVSCLAVSDKVKEYAQERLAETE